MDWMAFVPARHVPLYGRILRSATTWLELVRQIVYLSKTVGFPTFLSHR